MEIAEEADQLALNPLDMSDALRVVSGSALLADRCLFMMSQRPST